MRRKLFTLEEANGLLTWLEGSFARLDPYRAEYAKCRERQAALLQKGRGDGHSQLETEAHRLQQMLDELRKSIQDILEQITSRGITVRDLERGLVDFPAMRDGREVFLCWLRGEPEVRFWHDLDTGFAGRQPL